MYPFKLHRSKAVLVRVGRRDPLDTASRAKPVQSRQEYLYKKRGVVRLQTRVHHFVSKQIWSKRYVHIRHFEQLLHDSGVHILKFFLHISKAEQLARFKERLDDPAKQWKIRDADYQERQHWDAYQAAVEDALSECSTTQAPWFIIPANHKWFRDLVVSQIIVQALESLKMALPEPTVPLPQIRQQYHAAAAEEKKAGDANVSVADTP